ncbi:MAG: type II toxin-antitoxin system VapC family toxin [Candidatus Bathyarchaeia archaeon]|nr:type II toxin-antitoxin system VapC family toxin [Candidatus Bathyarchaeota archaeon]
MRFIDSNIFVYHMAEDPRYGEVAATIIKRIEDGEQVATSTLVISQVCGYLKWKGRFSVIPTFLTFLRSIPNLIKVDTTFLDFIQAQTFCVEHGIDWSMWDDLIISMQMKNLRIDEIYSNDIDFDKIPEVKRIFE